MGKKAEPPAPPSLQAFNDRAALGKNVLWSFFGQDLGGGRGGQRVSSGEAGQQVSIKVPAKNRELRFLDHASKGTGKWVRKVAAWCDASLTAGQRDWSSGAGWEAGGRGKLLPRPGPSPSHPNFNGQS